MGVGWPSCRLCDRLIYASQSCHENARSCRSARVAVGGNPEPSACGSGASELETRSASAFLEQYEARLWPASASLRRTGRGGVGVQPLSGSPPASCVSLTPVQPGGGVRRPQGMDRRFPVTAAAFVVLV